MIGPRITLDPLTDERGDESTDGAPAPRHDRAAPGSSRPRSPGLPLGGVASLPPDGVSTAMDGEVVTVSALPLGGAVTVSLGSAPLSSAPWPLPSGPPSPRPPRSTTARRAAPGASRPPRPPAARPARRGDASPPPGPLPRPPRSPGAGTPSHRSPARSPLPSGPPGLARRASIKVSLPASPSLASRIPAAFTVAGYLAVAVGIYLLAVAQPPSTFTLFEHMGAVPARTGWDRSALASSAGWFGGAWSLGMLGLLVQAARGGVRDRVWGPLLLLGLGTSAALVIFAATYL
ncbi:MAG: hypothetical protein ACFCGT_17345 [Sandaracinaceae bacterium]